VTIAVLLILALCVLCCLAAEAFFAGAETAIISADRAQLRAAAGRGDSRAALAESLLERAEALLSTTLVGTNLAVVTGTSLATLVVAHALERWGIAATYESTVTTLVLTPLILIFGEIVPKSIARGNAQAITLAIAKPLGWMQRLMHPVVALASRLTEAALGLLGSRPTGDSPFVSREELVALAAIGEEHGLIVSDERRMIQSVLELRERPVSTVLVPLVDMASLPATATVADLDALAARTGYSRFPVYERRVDNVVGVVSLIDVLETASNDAAATLPIAPFVVREASYVPETKSVGELLRELRYSELPMAIVVDEHGGVVGLATAEDLVAEIIGRIRDERHTGPDALSASDGSVFECDGKVDVEEAEERTGLTIEHGDFETVAGLVIKLTGRIPQVGDHVDLGTWRIEVIDATPRRVGRVRFVRKPPAQRGN